MDKPAHTSQPIHALLGGRWSPVAFDPDYAPTREETVALLEAARWAPSCYGAQPWRFVVCHKTLDPDAWQRAYDCLTPGNSGWNRDVPLLLLLCGRLEFEHNDKPNRHYAYDSGAAALSLVLQAEALGLRAHQMAGFSPEQARAAFSVPDGYDCLSMIAVGRQRGLETVADEKLRERDAGPRRRNPLPENFFAGAWGRGFEG